MKALGTIIGVLAIIMMIAPAVEARTIIYVQRGGSDCGYDRPYEQYGRTYFGDGSYLYKGRVYTYNPQDPYCFPDTVFYRHSYPGYYYSRFHYAEPCKYPRLYYQRHNRGCR